MSRPRCPRVWEAEAVENGQIAGADRASFERHASTCPVCEHEVEALASLRRDLSAMVPPEPSALDLRRLRGALLQRANANCIRSRRLGRPLWALGIVAALVLALAAAARVAAPRLRPSTAALATGPVFEIANVSGAIVTSRTEGGAALATLSAGVASFHVHRLEPGCRFRLVLPDGEIEVHGTRFIVAVQDDRTQSVEVTEGVVTLRLRGEDERWLAAGDRWSATQASTGALVAATRLRPPAPSSALEPGPSPQALPTTASGSRLGAAHHAAGAAPETPSAEPPAVDGARARAHDTANQQFAAAIAALGAGSDAQADMLLAAFARAFPEDARAEDASFLRAVARSRMGDAVGAASLARAYLQSFPDGLRRREAERLITAGAEGRAP